jgi:hypothetical protein
LICIKAAAFSGKDGRAGEKKVPFMEDQRTGARLRI